MFSDNKNIFYVLFDGMVVEKYFVLTIGLRCLGSEPEEPQV